MHAALLILQICTLLLFADLNAEPLPPTLEPTYLVQDMGMDDYQRIRCGNISSNLWCRNKTTTCDSTKNGEETDYFCACRPPLIQYNSTDCVLPNNMNRCELPLAHPFRWPCNLTNAECYWNTTGGYKCHCTDPINYHSNTPYSCLPRPPVIDDITPCTEDVWDYCDLETTFCIRLHSRPLDVFCICKDWMVESGDGRSCHPYLPKSITFSIRATHVLLGISMMILPPSLIILLVRTFFQHEVARWEHLSDLQDIDWTEINNIKAEWIKHIRLQQQQQDNSGIITMVGKNISTELDDGGDDNDEKARLLGET